MGGTGGPRRPDDKIERQTCDDRMTAGRREDRSPKERQKDKTTQTKHMFNKSSIIMKQFKNLILAGALVLGLAGFAVSCDKYGDDIDELTSRVGKLETQLTDLQTKIDAGVIVTGVTQTAGGVTIQTSNGTYTITNGEKGEKGEKGDKGDQGEKGQGSVVTLGENGNWFIDGVDTKIPYKGEKGDKGEDGKASVVEIGENGNWFIDGVDTGVKAGADGALSAVWDPEAGTLTLKNVEGYEGDYVLNLTATGVTSVELVASFAGANITTEINFATAVEQDNVFGVDPEDGKTLLPGAITFKKGEKSERNDVNVIVRVSPVNYALKAEEISFQNGNGETLDWVKVVSVEPYKRLYTRAAEPETGLWKIKVGLAKDYVKKDFEAATKVGKKNVLFAVKAQDAVSSYDVAFVYEDPKPEHKLNVMVDDKSIEEINNRNYSDGRLSGRNYYITSESFADGGEKVFIYKEKEWIDTAYTKLVEGKYKESQDDAKGTVVVDNRNDELAYNAVQEVPITITIPELNASGQPITDHGELVPNKNIRAMYVTLDYEACAVESAPSEWVSWNSYEYEGLNEVVEGTTTDITIYSDKAINDYIGFRVYAVNYDGTLVDPDGRAFYVKLGTDAPTVDWNKGTVPATTVTPLANPNSYTKQNPTAKPGTNVFSAQNTHSDIKAVSLTDIANAASYTLEPAKAGEPVPFNVTLASEDLKTLYVFTVNRDFKGDNKIALADVDFTKLTKVYTTPTIDWKDLEDGKTYTAVLTIKDNTGSALATLTVSMKKELPTEDPENAFVFNTSYLENGIFYHILAPVGKEGTINKVRSTFFVEKQYNKVWQKDYYTNLGFEDSKLTSDRKSTTYVEVNATTDELEVKAIDTLNGKPRYFIDGKTSHDTYVVYNYGEITKPSASTKTYGSVSAALDELKGKTGAFIVKNANVYTYYVKVSKVNTVYCTPYNHEYEFSWVTRELLNEIESTTKWTKKDKDGQYETALPSYLKEKYEFKYGESLQFNFSAVYGTSSHDGKYSKYLEDIKAADGLSLKPNQGNELSMYVLINGQKSDLYYWANNSKFGTGFTGDPEFACFAGPENITSPITATLVVECVDAYNAPYTISLDFTINPR